MHYKKPHYYEDFTCVAKECPDTCCAGWQIVIDEKSLDKYEAVTGAFGKRLQESIDWEEGIFKQYQRRCAFLNQENLCDLYTELGEDCLCDTCRMYPRHVEEFEDLREFSLSLSCPVAAEMILSCKEPVRFLEEMDETEEKEEDYEDFDVILFDWLEEARKELMKIIQNRSISVAIRMTVLLDFTYTAQKALDQGILLELDIIKELEKALFQAENSIKNGWDDAAFEYKKIMLKDLKKLEVLREEWPVLLEQLEENLYSKGMDIHCEISRLFLKDICKTQAEREQWEVYKEQLLVFFLYTYFCGAVYDDMIYTKAVLAVFSVLWIEEICINCWMRNGKELGFEDVVNVAYRYAREIEHSDENLLLLEEFFDTRSVYYPEKLKVIINFRQEL